jgi:hypothetical protein
MPKYVINSETERTKTTVYCFLTYRIFYILIWQWWLYQSYNFRSLQENFWIEPWKEKQLFSSQYPQLLCYRIYLIYYRRLKICYQWKKKWLVMLGYTYMLILSSCSPVYHISLDFKFIHCTWCNKNWKSFASGS